MKKFTSSQKSKVALLALQGTKTVPEISQLFGVHPTQVNNWKKQAQQYIQESFNDKRTKEGKSQERLIQELYQLIGKRDTELEWLKKSLAPFEP